MAEKDPLAKIVEQLRAEAAREEAEVADAEKRGQRSKAKLRDIQKAIADLTGERSGNGGKPAAKKADVSAAATAALAAGPLPAKTLKSKVENTLRPNFNLSGVALRLKEVLASPEFEVDEAGNVRLVSPSAAHQSKAKAAK